LQDQFEGKLRDAKRQTTEVEEELEAASERWRSERKRLNGEIDRLEAALAEAKTTGKKPAKARGGADNGDAGTDWASMVAAAEDRLTKASGEWESERSRMRSEILRLENNVAEILERSNNPVRSLQAVQQKLETDVQDAIAGRQRAQEELERARASWEEERMKMAGELFRARRGEAGASAEGADGELQRVRNELDSVRRQLEEARASLKTKPAPVPDGASAKLAEELTRQKADLARELSRATTLLTEERQTSETASAELRRAREELQRARAEIVVLQQRPAAPPQSDPQALDQVTAENSARMETLAREKTALAGKVQEASALAEEERRRAEAAGEELRRTQLELQQLERRLAERDGAVTADALETLRAQYASELQQLSEKNSELSGRLESAGVLIEQERQRSASLSGDLSKARTESQQMERRLAENRATVSEEVVEQLRTQYTAKLQEIAQEKTTLAQELESASAMLEQERQRFAEATSSGSSGGIDGEVLEREVTRVEEAIAEISRLIDDPATQLAVVIRKNVERAELDAYLKGIRFARGQVEAKEKQVCGTAAGNRE
ncbi:MAG TPA: hypothetical protein VFY29_07225, partial [Terriglobia bacterium]|nr:hypothetical protein [Terriglobia bacterium]